MPSPSSLTKTEKPMQDPGHNPFLTHPPKVKGAVGTQTGKSFSNRSLSGDNIASMNPQHYKELVARVTAGVPKPYGAIPPPRQRSTRRKFTTQALNPAELRSPIMREDIEIAEEEIFGAYPPTTSRSTTSTTSRSRSTSTSATVPSVWVPPPYTSSSSGNNGKSSQKLSKRHSLPATLTKPTPSVSTSNNNINSSKPSFVAFPPLKRTLSTPSRSSPTSLLRLSSSASAIAQSSLSNRILQKLSISPPASTLRALNPFSTSPPPSVEKSSVLTSPTDIKSMGKFFTFLDDVAPVVAAAGGELVGISDMPKWAVMGGTTSATVSTLSALLRNNDRLRAEKQADNSDPPPSRSSRMSTSSIKQSTTASDAPPAPLVVPGRHVHVREPRANPAHLRMMAAEMNMMRAGKLVSPLRPRGWLPRRRDAWGSVKNAQRSVLRNEVLVC